jgi:hypothetical protein
MVSASPPASIEQSGAQIAAPAQREPICTTAPTRRAVTPTLKRVRAGGNASRSSPIDFQLLALYMNRSLRQKAGMNRHA